MSSKMLFWTVFSEKSITCDINSLWNVISSPSNLDLFHPFCKKNTVVKWSKENSIDIVGFSIKNLKLFVFDMDHINETLMENESIKIHGIIGNDIMSKHEAIISFSEKKIYLKLDL